MIQDYEISSVADPLYEISEIYSTVQGEGMRAGTPVTLLRLQGCSVGCTWCDTKYSWPEKSSAAPSRWGEVVEMWKTTKRGTDWVLLTGGEPCQQDLTKLVEALTSFGARIMLETSGAFCGHLLCSDLIEHITVSPKLARLEKFPVLHQSLQCADELKFVIQNERDVELVRAFVCKREVAHRVRMGLVTVSVQPEASALETSMSVATEAAQMYGWRLSVQTHKLIGLK